MLVLLRPKPVTHRMQTFFCHLLCMDVDRVLICLHGCWTTEAGRPSGNVHSTERGFCSPLVVGLRLLCINLQVLVVISSRYMCSGLKLHYLQCCFNLEVFHPITILIILT